MKFSFPSGIANSSTCSFTLPSTYILLLSVLRSCGNPGRPSYAVVSGKSYWVGSIVRYFCNPGYTLIGRGVRRCMSSGSWSGKTPKCRCQRRILIIKTRNLKRIWRILASFLLQNWVPQHSSGFTSHVLKKGVWLFFSHKSIKDDKIRVSVIVVIVNQHLFCQTFTDYLENNLKLGEEGISIIFHLSFLTHSARQYDVTK